MRTVKQAGKQTSRQQTKTFRITEAVKGKSSQLSRQTDVNPDMTMTSGKAGRQTAAGRTTSFLQRYQNIVLSSYIPVSDPQLLQKCISRRTILTKTIYSFSYLCGCEYFWV